MKYFAGRVLAILGIVLVLIFAVGKQYAGARDAASESAAAATSPFTDSHGETPGPVHPITPAGLPPYATKSAAVFTPPIARPADAWPKASAGLKVELFADQLENPG